MSNPPQRISLYNATDLKNTTDDAIAPYLTSLPAPYTFTQNHRLIDTRLAVGYAAVTIAGALFYADWKLGWDGTKAWTLPACVAYFILNGFLTYWIWAVEAGTVFEGQRPGGQKLTIKSSGRKNSPVYRLKVTYQAPETGTKWENDKEITGRFTDWFNVHGYIDQKAFKRWLAVNIEVVGLADPKSKQEAAAAAGTAATGTVGTTSVDDMTMAAIASGLTTTNNTTTATAHSLTTTTTTPTAKKSKKKT